MKFSIKQAVWIVLIAFAGLALLRWVNSKTGDPVTGTVRGMVGV